MIFVRKNKQLCLGSPALLKKKTEIIETFLKQLFNHSEPVSNQPYIQPRLFNPLIQAT